MNWIASLVLTSLIAQQNVVRVAPAPRKEAFVKLQSSVEPPLDWVRVAKLTVHDPGVLALDPRVSSVVADLRSLLRDLGDEGRQADAFIEAFRQGKPWPVELHVFGQPGPARRLLMPIFYNAESFDMASAVFATDKSVASRAVAFDWNGQRYQVCPVKAKPRSTDRSGRSTSASFGTVVFGKFEGRGMALLTNTLDPMDTPLEEARHCLRELKKCNPLTRPIPASLAPKLQGRGIEFVFMLDEMWSVLTTPEKRAQGLAAFGGRLDGFVSRLDSQGGNLVAETFADIRAGSGILGALFATSSRPSTLRGWIPRKTEDFVHLKLDFANLGTAMAAAKAADLPVHPRQWGDRFILVRKALGAADPVKVVTENLTGELAYVSGARGEMGTLLVGAKNGTKILEWAGRYVAAEGPSLGIAMEAVKGNLPGLHVVTMDKKPVGYVLARSGFVAFSQATQSSLVTLKAILATEGKAVLPDAFAERAGGDVSMAPCTAMMLQDWARQVGGAASAVGLDDALEGVEGTRVKPMTRTLAGNKGSCAAWVVCDAEGLTLRAIW